MKRVYEEPLVKLLAGKGALEDLRGPWVLSEHSGAGIRLCYFRFSCDVIIFQNEILPFLLRF